jgi:hypothetical protein
MLLDCVFLHLKCRIYFSFWLDELHQVTNALLQLRQRNKYQDNVVPPWHRLTSQGTITHGNSDVESSDCTADTAPALAEMTVLARKHARLMVTTAVNVPLYNLSCFHF